MMALRLMGSSYRAEVLHGCIKAQQCFVWLSTSGTSQCHPLLFLDVSSDLWRVAHLLESKVLHMKHLILVMFHPVMKPT